MKTKQILPLVFMASIMLLSAFTLTKSKSNAVAPNETGSQLLTPDVKAIIDQSCVGCHNAESKNDKGKAKLMFESLDTLSTARLVAKLEAIHEVVNDGSMPPAKFLEFKPEAALNAAQKASLLKWADNNIEQRLKKME